MIFDHNVEPLKAARQRQALGLLRDSHTLYGLALATCATEAERESARYGLRQTARILARRDCPAEWILTRHFDDQSAEHQESSRKYYNRFEDFALSGVKVDKIADPNRIHFPYRHVFYSFSDEAQELEYVKTSFYRGFSTVMIKSDEWYTAENNIDEFIKYVDVVIYSYFSAEIAKYKKCIYIPLMFLMNGFLPPPDEQSEKYDRPASARPYTWSFMGGINKSSRKQMFDSMQAVPNGAHHLTMGWMTEDALAPRDYRTVMDNSVFVPCPAGWSNLESYRVWEALEAGCIPLVERREGYDYFSLALGNHPLPTFDCWDQVPGFIAGLDPSAVEGLRSTCSAWWKNYKLSLKDKIAAEMLKL
ncbi:hypothetical protein IP70_20925 [alpha proteobacterium AAP38]|nr:hypothetical protein IP70_20925 [alpha proteobacterium AAP38]